MKQRQQQQHSTYDQRSLSTSFSSAFSDCSFTTDIRANPAPSIPSSDALHSLVSDLDSSDPLLQLNAAEQLRLLAKNSPENRLLIAKAGAVLPLVSLLSSPDPLLQEHSVTALLNLSLLDVNRPLLAAAGAVPALSSTLRSGSPSSRANAACALLRLSQLPSLLPSISSSMSLLVDLLRSVDTRGKKDAATALYALCSAAPENKLRAVRSGLVRPLLALMSDGEPGIADKAAYLLAVVAPTREAREDIVAEGGVAVLVETIKAGGTPRQKEAAVDVLLRVCEENPACCTMAAREGAAPALAALSLSGTLRSNKKAVALLEVLNVWRTEGSAMGVLDVPG